MSESPRVDASKLKKFTERVFVGLRIPTDEAELVSGHLVQANLMGYDSHGVIRICQYVADVRNRRIVPGAPVTLNHQTDTTAIVDCGWNFGQVGGYRALQCAMEKARSHNISIVVTKRCGHAGRLGAYTQAAAEQGFIALGFCNSPPGDGHSMPPGEDGKGVSPPIPCLSQCPAEQSRPFWAIFRQRRLPRGNSDSI